MLFKGEGERGEGGKEKGGTKARLAWCTPGSGKMSLSLLKNKVMPHLKKGKLFKNKPKSISKQKSILQ